MLRVLLVLLLFPVYSFSQLELIAIKDVNLIDVEAGEVVPSQTVLISGNRIKNIGKSLSVPTAAKVIEAKGKYLIPGLVDFNASVLNYESSEEPALLLMLANGITSVRDLHPRVPLSFGVQLKKELESGIRLGPRLYLVSYLITTKGTREKKIVVQSPQQAAAAVDSSVAAGAEVIKLDHTLSPSVLGAVVSRSKYYRVPTVGGISTSFIDASRSGINMIDHAADLRRVTTKNRELYFNFYRSDSSRIVSREDFYNRVLPSLGSIDSVYFKKVVQVMKQNQTSLVIGPASFMPSIQKFEVLDTSRRQYKSKRQMTALNKAKEDNEKVVGIDRYKSFVDMSEIKWAHDLGLDIVAGSQMYDFMTPGFSLHDSFYWMQANGFKPIDILRTATINPARFMKKEQESGSIRKGKLADLVLLDKNPIENIENTRKIAAVVINGKLLERKDLDKLLQDVKKK